jgi:hypothetical protein
MKVVGTLLNEEGRPVQSAQSLRRCPGLPLRKMMLVEILCKELCPRHMKGCTAFYEGGLLPSYRPWFHVCATPANSDHFKRLAERFPRKFILSRMFSFLLSFPTPTDSRLSSEALPLHSVEPFHQVNVMRPGVITGHIYDNESGRKSEKGTSNGVPSIPFALSFKVPSTWSTGITIPKNGLLVANGKLLESRRNTIYTSQVSLRYLDRQVSPTRVQRHNQILRLPYFDTAAQEARPAILITATMKPGVRHPAGLRKCRTKTVTFRGNRI